MRVGRILPLVVLAVAATAPSQVDTVRRGAAITLKVASYAEAQRALVDLVAKHGGVAADRRQVSSAGDRHSGWTRLVVPKDQLDGFLADLRGLGKEYGERLDLRNNASLYADLGKRAERLRQHEARLSAFLNHRGLRGSDILFIQERLYRASTDEDTLTESRDAIPRQAAKSSVVVTFFEPAPVPAQPRGILGHLKASFFDALRGLAITLLSWIGPALYWLTIAILAALGWFVFRRPIRAGYGRLRDAIVTVGQPKLPREQEKPPT